MLANILGWTATVLFTLCYVPQIIVTLKQKTTKGLSFWMIAIQFIANIIALVYATLISQAPLQIKYILALVFLSVCIFTYLRYRNK